jgi:hypothetical protein
MSWRRRDSTSRLYELPVGVLPGDLVAPELEQVAVAYLARSYIGPLRRRLVGGARPSECSTSSPAHLSG